MNKPKRLVGVDLGLKRLVTAYVVDTTSEEGSCAIFLHKEEYKEFFIRMRRLNNRIAKLQRLRKYNVLKKLKHKRRNYARDFRRKLAVEVAKHFSDALIFIGASFLHSL